MIHIFGDSHASFNFKGLDMANENHSMVSLTMNRCGRDSLACINFREYNIKDDDTVIFQIGEVDCRCHIKRQILLHREEDEVIESLAKSFIQFIRMNAQQYEKLNIIICCVPPPMNQSYYEQLNGPILHEFPFVGTDIERIRFTNKVNQLLSYYCQMHNYSFFDYYDYYVNEYGTLKVEISDNLVHIKDNQVILDLFKKFFASKK